MKYEELINSHLNYGTTKENIRNRKGYTQILENVVIAPWWNHDIFDGLGFEVVQTSEKVFNFYSDELSFSYIELKRIGAPSVMDFVLSLGVTKCKKFNIFRLCRFFRQKYQDRRYSCTSIFNLW